MTSLTTFYLSGIIGKEAFGADGDAIGVIKGSCLSILFHRDRMILTSSLLPELN